MRSIFTLISLLLLTSSTGAQKLTGIWRGYFSSSNGVYREGVRDEMYRYEIQIEQQSNNGLKGVTYSFKSTVFYGKAEIQGILTLPSKSMIIKEIKLLDLKVGDKSEPCLMTCYLDYSKIGKLEVLEGTFISINIKDKSDCGSGKVYLERVATTEFKKEPFLEKRNSSVTQLENKSKPGAKLPGIIFPSHKDNVIAKTPPLNPATPPQKKPGTATAGKQGNKTTAKNNPPNKSKPITNPAERIAEEPVFSKKAETTALHQPENQITKIPIPRVLEEREHNLVRTITTGEENIKLDL